MTVAIDDKAPVEITLAGKEKMGNTMGTESTTGPASTVLTANIASLRNALPKKTLTISNVFPVQTLVFPFDRLNAPAEESLSTCFKGD